MGIGGEKFNTFFVMKNKSFIDSTKKIRRERKNCERNKKTVRYNRK